MTYEEYVYYPSKDSNGNFVFKNKYNINDSIRLSQKEHEISIHKLDLKNEYPKGNFDKQHFIEFNKYIFGDLFEFAGEIKKWNLSKGQDILGGYSVRYCPVELIDQNIDEAIKKLKQINFKERPESYFKQVADSWAYLWQTHPFYEGNTRTTATFMTAFLESKGISFNKEVMAKSYHDFRDALVLYTIGKEDKLNNLILEGFTPELEKSKDQPEEEIEL